jgi:hypothetical protein
MKGRGLENTFRVVAAALGVTVDISIVFNAFRMGVVFPPHL